MCVTLRYESGVESSGKRGSYLENVFWSGTRKVTEEKQIPANLCDCNDKIIGVGELQRY